MVGCCQGTAPLLVCVFSYLTGRELASWMVKKQPDEPLLRIKETRKVSSSTTLKYEIDCLIQIIFCLEKLVRLI
jgi:hypothetical protein